MSIDLQRCTVCGEPLTRWRLTTDARTCSDCNADEDRDEREAEAVRRRIRDQRFGEKWD